jgi:cyclic-di-GMP phosphodiesterase, flagellum assembly factor TipF
MTEKSGLFRVGKPSILISGLAAFALVAVIAVSGLLLTTRSPVNALIWIVLMAGIAAGVFALQQVVVLRLRVDKVSSELDVLSSRLLRVEGRISDADRHASPGLSSAVAEVTGEIALLGGLVRDLAVTVASQDKDVASLKDHVRRARDETPAAAPPLTPKTPPRTPAPSAEPDLSPRDRPIPSLLPLQGSLPAPTAAPQDRRPSSEVGDARRIAAVMQAFENDRIELHLQPIVSLPQRKTRFYEILARLRLADDTILVPAEFVPILERCNLAAELDRKVLTRAAGIARHLAGRGSETRVSCNISPASLENGILRAAGRIAEAYPDVAHRLILELPQAAWRALDADQAGTLALLRNKGLSFAMDRTTDLRFDPLALAERGVRYLKLPAEMLLEPESARGLDIEITDLTAVLSRAGIRLIAERVEHEKDVPNLIDLDVPLAQGFVFAPPRAIRPEVLVKPASDSELPAGFAQGAHSAQTGPGLLVQPAQTPSVVQVPQSAISPVAPVAPVGPANQGASPSISDAEERKPFRAFLRRTG